MKMSQMNKKIKLSRLSILLIFLINIIKLNAQISCDIKIDDWVSLPVCYGEDITMSVEANPGYAYQWAKNGIDIIGETNFYYTATITEDNSRYSVKVTNTETLEECSDEVTITMIESFDIEFKQTQLTCSNNNAENGQNAKVVATASGNNFKSFTYEWGSNVESNIWTNPNNPQEAIGLKAWREYYVVVTGVNANGDSCTQTATFTPRAYPNPKLEIISDPKDTAYIQNPFVKFGFEGDIDSVEYNSWSWAFFDNPDKPSEITSTSIEQEPTNVYAQVSKSGSPFRVELNVKSENYGCDTTFSTDIIVLPVKLKIPNIFTPNGDGINDFFIIDNDPTAASDDVDENKKRGFEYDGYNPLNDYYITTKLTIFNRWGRIVYKSEDYQNDWDGGNLPDATYFYVLECVGKYDDDCRYQGSVTIFGSGR